MDYNNYDEYRCDHCKRQMDLQEQQEFKDRGYEHLLCWDCFIKHEALLKKYYP